jgi:hypothetical protein
MIETVSSETHNNINRANTLSETKAAAKIASSFCCSPMVIDIRDYYDETAVGLHTAALDQTTVTGDVSIFVLSFPIKLSQNPGSSAHN